MSFLSIIKNKKNGHTNSGKQNHMCLSPGCTRQFVLNPTQKLISDDAKERIRLMLLERISLRGICRVMDVSMPWLLKYSESIYANTPEDLNVVVDMASIEEYSDNKLNEKIYSLLEDGIGHIEETEVLNLECEDIQKQEEEVHPENIDLESAIDQDIANEISDDYVHQILNDKNSVLFNMNPCEADEMWSFVDNKGNKKWIWLAMNLQNRQIIGFHIGDRSQVSAEALWESINPFFRKNCLFFTDSYKAYQNVIPEQNHIAINKSYKSRFTNHIERFNNTIRQRCSRLVRLALSFSKKMENHIAAIKYFIAEYNKEKALLV